MGFGPEGESHAVDVAHCFLQRIVAFKLRVCVDIGMDLEIDVEVSSAETETAPEDEPAAADDKGADERAGEPSAGVGRAAAEAAMVDRWLDVWKRSPEPSPASEESEGAEGAAAERPDVVDHQWTSRGSSTNRSYIFTPLRWRHGRSRWSSSNRSSAPASHDGHVSTQLASSSHARSIRRDSASDRSIRPNKEP